MHTKKPVITDAPTEFEQRIMTRLNVAFKLYDVEAIITFEHSKDGIHRQLKPFVLTRKINNFNTQARRRYRNVRDVEQFAKIMLDEAYPIEP